MKKYLPKFGNGGETANKERNGKKSKVKTSSNVDNVNTSQTQTSGAQASTDTPTEVNTNPQETQGSATGNTKKDRIKKGVTSGMEFAGAATDIISSQIDVAEDTGFQQQQAIGDALIKSGNPYAAAAGVAYKALSAIGEATGTNSNTLSKEQAKAAGVTGGQRFLNNLGSFVPLLGAAAKTTNNAFEMTADTQKLSSAFAGSIGDISMAGSMGGKRYLSGSHQINNLINEANRNNMIMTEMSKTNSLRKASDYGLDIAQQNLNRYAGNNYQNMHIGKHGMKLMSIEECRRILEARKGVEMFQNGGVLSGNILPTGKLHKELHHIEDSNPELAEDLTRKGIPVVAINEDGNFEEVAEIERDEWTLSKELTDKLESLWKDGSDEAMLECGKLMCEEILFNTRDDNNLLGNGNDTDKG